MNRLERRTRWLAGLWLVVVLAALGHNAWAWLVQRQAPATDVLAMLPRDEQRPRVAQATQALADAGVRRVFVLVGGGGWEQARAAGDAVAHALAELKPRYRVGDAEQQAWLASYLPHRGALLTPAGRATLQDAPVTQLADTAQAALYQPLAGPRFASWAEDPLGLFGHWLAERAQGSRVRVQDGRLMLTDPAAPQRHYAVLMLDLAASGFDIGAQRRVVERLDLARGLVPEAELIAAGVPLFAAAAAAQAEREVHTIGLGSLVGIVLLTVLAFRSLRPRLLVTLSMAVGLLCATSASLLLFGEVHLVTLVFGASLLGVAENYGSNYFAARQGLAPGERWTMLARQMPVMGLAMVTTVIGYALLALPPFPGLRQIAVFSAAGLVAAFVTVLWWFPLTDGGLMKPTRFADWLGAQRARWPALGRRGLLVLAVVMAALVLAGLARLRFNDDLRALQSAPPQLVAAQREFSRLMGAPGVAQFFVVRGRDAQQLLEREEALTARLRELAARGTIAGHQAVSDWLPSLARQQADRALWAARAPALSAALAQRLEQPVNFATAPDAPLLPDAWLAGPASEPLRAQWLGALDGGVASAVLLSGAEGAAARSVLAALRLDGVEWVDKVGDIGALLGRYRGLMLAVLLAGYVLTWAALAARFGRHAWRALAPTALASAATVSLLALLGVPLQLFHVLPLLILLGLGVDYGIFLLEQPGRHETRPFLSVTLSAACTLLSFGLLALSTTPALRAFGLTLLLGVFLAWLLTPFFLPHDDRDQEVLP
jgi:predicted exporter